MRNSSRSVPGPISTTTLYWIIAVFAILVFAPRSGADVVKSGNGWLVDIGGGTCDSGVTGIGCSGGAVPVLTSGGTYSLTAGYVDDHVFTTGAYAQASMTGDAGLFQDKLYIKSTGDVLASGDVRVRNSFAFSNLALGSDGLYHLQMSVWFDGSIVPLTNPEFNPTGAIDFHFDAIGWNPANGGTGGAPCTIVPNQNVPGAVGDGAGGYTTTLPLSGYPYSQVYQYDCAFTAPNAGFIGDMSLSTNGWMVWSLADFSDTAGIYFDLPSGATVTDATGTFQNLAPPSAAPVPEPASVLLFASGVLVMARRLRERKRS